MIPKIGMQDALFYWHVASKIQLFRFNRLFSYKHNKQVLMLIYPNGRVKTKVLYAQAKFQLALLINVN